MSAYQFTERVAGQIVGDSYQEVCAEIYDTARPGHLLSRRDGFPDDASAREWVLAEVAELRRWSFTGYPAGFDVQYHSH